MIIQSLDYTSTIVRRYINKNPQARLLTLYRLIRKRSDHSIIGSWPIIAELFFTVWENYRPVTAKELVNVCRRSDDLELQKLRTDSQIICQLLGEGELN